MILYTTIEKVFLKTKNQDGSPLINVNGDPYKQVGIKIAEYPEQWLTCYIGNKMKYPAKELEIQENESYWIVVEEKGKFVNFKLASRMDRLEKRMDEVEATVYKTPQAKPTTSKPLLNKKDIATAEPQYNESEYFEPSDVDMGSIPF